MLTALLVVSLSDCTASGNYDYDAIVADRLPGDDAATEIEVIPDREPSPLDEYPPPTSLGLNVLRITGFPALTGNGKLNLK